MTLDHADVVDGRIATIMFVLYLAFALLAHLILGPPISVLPMMLALGGLFTIVLQNLLLYLSEIAGPADEEPDTEPAG